MREGIVEVALTNRFLPIAPDYSVAWSSTRGPKPLGCRGSKLACGSRNRQTRTKLSCSQLSTFDSQLAATAPIHDLAGNFTQAAKPNTPAANQVYVYDNRQVEEVGVTGDRKLVALAIERELLRGGEPS